MGFRFGVGLLFWVFLVCFLMWGFCCFGFLGLCLFCCFVGFRWLCGVFDLRGFVGLLLV